MPENIRDLAEKPPEEIRQEIDETRSSITSKLEALEEQVVGTVQNAKETVEETINTVKETVQETVSTVKDTVQETVSTVKETFDLRLQVQRHPWPMVGGALAAGFATGALLGEIRHRREMPMDRLASDGAPMTESYRPEYRTNRAAEAPAPHEPGLLDRFRGELDQLKGLAIGVLFGVVRDVIKENVSAPEVADKIAEVLDGITSKLGGQPVRGPVFQTHGDRATPSYQAPRATVP